MVESGKQQTKIWRMRIACWIPKATKTHLGYVIIIAFIVALCNSALIYT